MRVLVTGSRGFVGSYMFEELRSAGYQPVPLTLPAGDGRRRQWVDVRHAAQVAEAVAEIRPRFCVHLAALSFVPEGESVPIDVFRVNVNGTIHLLDALAEHAPGTRCLLVSSAHVYGGRHDPGTRVTEETPLRPESMYALSKAAAELAALAREGRSGLEIVIARPVNHAGPGQSNRFVLPAIIDQARECRAGRRARMRVGNLDSTRDFLHVRDVARAYRLMLERGRRGTVYNVASGRIETIRTLLETICSRAGITPEIEIDRTRFRKSDNAPSLDTGRLRTDTGWAPQRDLSAIVDDMLQAGQA